MRMRVNAMYVSVRLGDAIDPCHLANGFEAVIGYECQERSNPLSLTRTIHTSHARCDKASEWVVFLDFIFVLFKVFLFLHPYH